MKSEPNRAHQLECLLRERIVVLDGAMGTMVQQHKLDEAAYRGERFNHWHKDLKGLHDLLERVSPGLCKISKKGFSQNLGAGQERSRRRRTNGPTFPPSLRPSTRRRHSRCIQRLRWFESAKTCQTAALRRGP